MYTEDDYNKNYSVRSLLLKIFLILIIIILLIWIVPKFFSYKKKNNSTKKDEVVTVVKIKNATMTKLEKAGLTYFKEDSLPKDDKEEKKVTLKELKDAKATGDIKNGTTTCDVNKSYVLLTKTGDGYSIKSYLKCGNAEDYILTNVGKYSYCSPNTLCKKDDTKEEPKEEPKVEPKEEPKTDPTPETPKTKVLSDFSEWKSYEKTSCDTKEVTCDVNDVNCLQEVKIYSRKEVVGTKTTPKTTQHTALKFVESKKLTTCTGYNYVVISNNIFRTKGNYGEILSLGKTSSTNWTYRGQITTTTTPSFGGNEYYKYVGTTNGVHYYDSYKYNYAMEKVSSYTAGCSSTSSKNVNIYTVYKQTETYNVVEDVYATACYKSVRTRTYN